MDTTGPTQEAIRVLTRIGIMVDKRNALDDEIHHEIMRARMANASWRMIGTTLGVSTQAAWEKYRPQEQPQVPGGDPQLPLLGQD